MIKKLLFISLFFVCKSFSQQEVLADSSLAADSLASASDSVSISELVALQIKSAKEKEEQLVSETASVEVDERTEIPWKKNESFLSDFNFFSNRYLILGIAGVILFGFVFLRRKAFEKKNKSIKKLKKNIQLIREERALKISNPKMNEIRIALRKNPSSLTNDEVEITKTAKELNISKGEILLAARIKSFELRMER